MSFYPRPISLFLPYHDKAASQHPKFKNSNKRHLKNLHFEKIDSKSNSPGS